jgi:hypothetical protein
VKTDKAVGCLLTVTNHGANTANQVKVTVTADNGGTFLSSTSPLCVPNGSTLTCNIGQLSGVGTPNSTFTEKHELDMPSSGASVTQTAAGTFSQKPNNRGSETIAPVKAETTQSDNPDFDALFANSGADTAQTDTNISETNPYTTGAVLFGTFTVGLSVEEKDIVGNNPNCPTTGCFGGQVIEFEITPLPTTADPTSYTLEIKIADAAIDNNVKEHQLEVRHDGVPVLLCGGDVDPAEVPCILDRDIATSTPKDATILIAGPGDQNGSWGVGGGA